MDHFFVVLNDGFVRILVNPLQSVDIGNSQCLGFHTGGLQGLVKKTNGSLGIMTQVGNNSKMKRQIVHIFKRDRVFLVFLQKDLAEMLAFGLNYTKKRYAGRDIYNGSVDYRPTGHSDGNCNFWCHS